ncbi:hypothetical protein N7476_000343 [Penicillium atrosanguineum]|uniref:Uncharacterized protein n=1 Tax=Penicillium atrosanguineum TaxID=1132637 RepID=A0A9W9UDU2_9EURO|nr:hypothetical protein N7476_000343 [Penicillium atrosanguineum]
MTTAQNRLPRHGEQRASEMETTGFIVFSVSSDGADVGAEVKRSLYSGPKVEKGPLVYGRGNPDTCKRFLQCGTAETNAFSEKIKEAIGEVGFLLRQGPVIVVSTENHVEWGVRLAHPSRGAVSAFRDLSQANETRVIFKLYPPDLPKEAIHETRSVARKLRPNEILFVKGSVMMEIEIPSKGGFVWQGNSGDPMGFDMIGPKVFEFMTI